MVRGRTWEVELSGGEKLSLGSRVFRSTPGESAAGSRRAAATQRQAPAPLDEGSDEDADDVSDVGDGGERWE